MLPILMSSHGLSNFLLTLAFSIMVTTSMPRTTAPNTECLLSSQGVGTVVMKNCDLHARTGVSAPPLHMHLMEGTIVVGLLMAQQRMCSRRGALWVECTRPVC